jgi:hypothetical protein
MRVNFNEVYNDMLRKRDSMVSIFVVEGGVTPCSIIFVYSSDITDSSVIQKPGGHSFFWEFKGRHEKILKTRD